MNQEILRKPGNMTLLVICDLFNKQIGRLKGNEISQDRRLNAPCQQMGRGHKATKSLLMEGWPVQEFRGH